MIYILLVITLFPLLIRLYYYFKLRLEEVNTLQKNGLAKDFGVFLERFLFHSSRVMTLKGKTLQIKDSHTLFSLTRVHDRISVVWTWSSLKFGRRGKEWSFPYNVDQIKMYEEISKDIQLYRQATYREYNLIAPPEV